MRREGRELVFVEREKQRRGKNCMQMKRETQRKVSANSRKTLSHRRRQKGELKELWSKCGDFFLYVWMSSKKYLESPGSASCPLSLLIMAIWAVGTSLI